LIVVHEGVVCVARTADGLRRVRGSQVQPDWRVADVDCTDVSSDIRPSTHGTHANHLRHEDHQQRPRQATDERLYGLVTWSAAQDGARQPEDAQFGDLEATRCRLEATGRDGEATVHRRGEATARVAHGRTPRLQVQASTTSQVNPNGGRETVSRHVQAGDDRPRQSWHSIRTYPRHRLAHAFVNSFRLTAVRLVLLG